MSEKVVPISAARKQPKKPAPEPAKPNSESQFGPVYVE